MAARKFAQIDHHSGVKLLLEGAETKGAVVSLLVQFNTVLRIDIPLDLSELSELRNGIDKAIAHCKKIA